MSNHSGSYMLNSILELLDEKYNFFKNKTPGEIAEIFNDFTSVGQGYDTNDGEILDAIGLKYNICYNCLKPVKNLSDDGWCSYCEDNTNLDHIKLLDTEIEIIEKECTKRYYKSFEYEGIYKKTGYKTSVYSNKNNVIIEIKRYLNGDFLEKY